MILYTSTLSPADYLPACSSVETSATLGNRPLILGIALQPVHRQESLPMAFAREKRTTSGRASQTLSTAVFLHSMSGSAQAASFKQNKHRAQEQSKKHLAAREAAPLQPQFRPFFKQPTLADRCLCLPHCRLVKHLLTQMRKGKPGRVCGFAIRPRGDADNNATCFHVTQIIPKCTTGLEYGNPREEHPEVWREENHAFMETAPDNKTLQKTERMGTPSRSPRVLTKAT